MSTTIDRVRMTGVAAADVMAAGLGSPSCERAVDRLVRASVIEEALTLLEKSIEDGDEPWEWSFSGSGCGVRRRQYEAAIATLRAEAESDHKDANSELMWGRIFRRQRKAEKLKALEEFAVQRRIGNGLGRLLTGQV